MTIQQQLYLMIQDYNKAGSYEAYYLATDSFGLETYAYITISIISSDVAETFEDFRGLLDRQVQVMLVVNLLGITVLSISPRENANIRWKTMTFW